MDKIYRIQRTQVKIQCGVWFSIMFVFLGIPLVEQFLLRVSDQRELGDWYIYVMIIIIIANVALSIIWRRITNKRIKAVVEEFNEKCEYHTKHNDNPEKQAQKCPKASY